MHPSVYDTDSDDGLEDVPPEQSFEDLLDAIENPPGLINAIISHTPEALEFQDENGNNALQHCLSINPPPLQSLYLLIRAIKNHTQLNFHHLLINKNHKEENFPNMLHVVCKNKDLIASLSNEDFIFLMFSILEIESRRLNPSLSITTKLTSHLVHEIFSTRTDLSTIPQQYRDTIMTGLSNLLARLINDPTSLEFQKIAAVLHAHDAFDFEAIAQEIVKHKEIDFFGIINNITNISNRLIGEHEDNLENIINFLNQLCKTLPHYVIAQILPTFQKVTDKIQEESEDFHYLQSQLKALTSTAIEKGIFEAFEYSLSLYDSIQDIEEVIDSLNLQKHEDPNLFISATISLLERGVNIKNLQVDPELENTSSSYVYDITRGIEILVRQIQDKIDFRVIKDTIDKLSELTRNRKVLTCKIDQSTPPKELSVIELLILSGRTDVLQYLRDEKDYDMKRYVNERTGPNGNCYLHRSHYQGVTSVKTLLALGANPFAVNIHELTPLHIMAANCQESLFTLIDVIPLDIKELRINEGVDAGLDPVQFAIKHMHTRTKGINQRFLCDLILATYEDFPVSLTGRTIVESALLSQNPQTLEIVLMNRDMKEIVSHSAPEKIVLAHQMFKELKVPPELSPLIFFARHQGLVLPPDAKSLEEKIQRIVSSNLDLYLRDPIKYMASKMTSASCKETEAKFAKSVTLDICKQLKEQQEDLHDKDLQAELEKETNPEKIKELCKSILSEKQQAIFRISDIDAKNSLVKRIIDKNRMSIIETAITNNQDGSGAFKCLLLHNPWLVDEEITTKTSRRSITRYITDEHRDVNAGDSRKASLLHSAIDFYRAIATLETCREDIINPADKVNLEKFLTREGIALKDLLPQIEVEKVKKESLYDTTMDKITPPREPSRATLSADSGRGPSTSPTDQQVDGRDTSRPLFLSQP